MTSGLLLTKLTRFTMSDEDLILMAKSMVAKNHNYPDDIMGTAWDFAMQITHRTKAQIQLYEEVILVVISLNSK